MSAAALLAEARAAGLSIRLADGKAKVAGNPSPDLLARLREVRAELIELLRAEEAELPYPLGWRGWPDEPVADPAAKIPDLAKAPLGTCRACRFTVPLNTTNLCGKCAYQRSVELALRGAA
jgi:hypothetical protein